MVNYTTVRIRKSSLEKIDKMKGDNSSVADVIEKLLNMVDGCSIDDVVEVKRESVAINLEYTVFDQGTFKLKKEYGITFKDLRDGMVGDVFTANPNPDDMYYMVDEAEILYIDEESVLVRVTEIIKTEKGESSMNHLEHVDLF